jgi:fused signal recognition particle receptor
MNASIELLAAPVIALAAVLVVALLVAAGLVSSGRLRRRGGGPGSPPTAPPAVADRIPPARAEGGLADRIRGLFRAGPATDQTWRDLEETLVRADVGPGASAEIVRRVRASYEPPADPAEVVSEAVAQTFRSDPPWRPPSGSPGIVMVVGVNGTGKTTTIGKLAHVLRRDGLSVSVANSDTFRAAAGEQLETWAGRAGAHLVAQARGADPGAVAFDAVKAAGARGSDVLIVDTAGRLHTRQPLMAELSKVRRVLEKAAGRAPDEVLLVLDATTGQNGIAQARAFTDAVGVTGIVLTKFDGSARGGIVLSVRDELGVPVKLLGTGEGPFDLIPFDPQQFAHRLVG